MDPAAPVHCPNCGALVATGAEGGVAACEYCKAKVRLGRDPRAPRRTAAADGDVRGISAGAAAWVALGLAAAAVVWLVARKKPAPPAPPPPVVSVPAERPRDEPPGPAAVRIGVRSRPPGATVRRLDSGAALGETPLDFVLPRGETGIEIEVSLAGHRTARAGVRADADQVVEIALARGDDAVGAVEIAPGTLDVRGALDRKVIRRVVGQHLAQIKRCYERGLAANPALAGSAVVRFTIAGDGAVVASTVQQSTLGNATVEQCIAAAVRRWRFPAPSGGGIVDVSYPFVLRAR